MILVLGIAAFTFFTRDQSSLQVFQATVSRDCAPWDGSAFTISIQYDATSTLAIFIWQAPDIKLPTTLSIPGRKDQVGYAYILPEIDPLMPLTGEVSFQRVSVDEPVEGRFNFTSERGDQIAGRFVAEWNDEVIMCG